MVKILFLLLALNITVKANEADQDKIYKACYDGLTDAYFSQKHSEPSGMYTKSPMKLGKVTRIGRWVLASISIEARDPGQAILYHAKDGRYVFVVNGTAFPDVDEKSKYYICNGWHIPTEIFVGKRRLKA